jgi:flagellar biosynthesis chaperone FliJ
MQARLASYTVQQWSKDFIEQLNVAHQSHRGVLSKRLTQVDTKEIIFPTIPANSPNLGL